ncbi:MAG: T9SS type A sorting domain-containing protein [Ignavibacteriae bacterium]|nr:T9SS type A sorting domain-containing protein [Ignavibacteriota bacterium]
MNIAKTMNALYSTYTPPMSVSDYAIPAAFSLDQNYPNPFNPTTTISYIVCVGTGPAGTTLAGRHALSLRVYDVLGREVATLMKDVVDQGRYSVTWNAEGYGSGVYFYRLESGGFSQTKRMILMK